MTNRRRALLLLCRCLSPYVEAQAVRVDLGAADWEAVVNIANHYFLVPALWAGLAGKGLLDEIPPAPRDYLTAMYRFNAQRNGELRAQLEEAVAVLNRAGIEPLLLKGAVALVAPGEFEGARFMLDLDLWVGPDLAEVAAEALTGAGYGFKEQNDLLADQHHLPGLFLPGAPARIEVHRRLLSSAGLDASLSKGLETEPVVLANGARARVMPLRYQLLHNFIHSEISHSAHANFYLDLRQMAGFALVARAGGVDAAQLVASTRSLGLGSVWDVYSFAMSRLFGMPLPGGKPGLATRGHYGTRLMLFDLAPRHPWVWRSWAFFLRAQHAFSRQNLEFRYGAPWQPFTTRLRHCVFLARKYHRLEQRRLLADQLGHSLRGWSGWQ